MDKSFRSHNKKREQLGYDPVSEEEIKQNDFYNYYRRKYFWESLIADVPKFVLWIGAIGLVVWWLIF